MRVQTQNNKNQESTEQLDIDTFGSDPWIQIDSVAGFVVCVIWYLSKTNALGYF